MRILPDAKDLINVVEHDRGVTFIDFERYLQQGNHQIVLTSTNVLELAAPLAKNGDFLEMRALLQKVEKLPLKYMKEWTIPLLELRAAKIAFDASLEYKEIDPYVKRWDDTISPLGKPTPTEALVALRLDEMIRMLWRADPTSLEFPSKQVGPVIRGQYDAKRLTAATPRLLAKAEFVKTVEQQFQAWAIPADGTDLTALANWIYSNPSRCPGLRMHHDTRYELLGDVGTQLLDNDTMDFAYLYAIPYVEGITLDRRTTGYATSVARRLKKANATIDYVGRIFPSIGELMRSNP